MLEPRDSWCVRCESGWPTNIETYLYGHTCKNHAFFLHIHESLISPLIFLMECMRCTNLNVCIKNVEVKEEEETLSTALHLNARRDFFSSRGERNPTLPLYLFYFIYFILFILFLYTFFDISKSIRIKNQILNLF